MINEVEAKASTKFFSQKAIFPIDICGIMLYNNKRKEHSRGSPEQEMEDKKMQKVYIVWFVNENGRHAMWAVYASEEHAAEKVEMLKQDYNYKAWYNEERVL